MKTKTYTFTEIEMLALRDSLTVMSFEIKNLNCNAPIFSDRNKAIITLKEQFKNDYSLI